MDFATSFLKEKQVIRLLKDYCHTPRSFEQIEQFLAHDCAYDAVEMRQRIKVVLNLIDQHFLVSPSTDRWRFSLNEERVAQVYGADENSAKEELLPVTLQQFRQFLKFVSVFYELSHNQLSFSAQQEIMSPQGKLMPSAEEYSLVKQVTLNPAPSTNLNLQIKAAQAQVKLYQRDFLRLNSSKLKQNNENSLFLGWPLLVTSNDKERSYTPIFYFVLTKAQMDELGIISSTQVIGPFFNKEAFREKAKGLFNTKIIDAFSEHVYDKFSQSNSVLESIAPLCESIRFFFSERCYGYTFNQLSSLVSLSEIEHCDNRIVFAATLSISQPTNYDKNTIRELKLIAQASDKELMQSALSSFFYDEQSIKVRAKAESQDAAAEQQYKAANCFNPFDVSSRSALVFNFDARYPCDEDQAKAVRSMLKNDLTVLQGPPGTGKTLTVVNAAYNHLVRGQKVLVTSFNNAAIEAFYDKAKFQLDTDFSMSDTYRLAKLLKDPKANNALTFKQLARELSSRSKQIDFEHTFSSFSNKVLAQEQQIAALEQLRMRYDHEYNSLQTKVDSLAQSLFYRYTQIFPEANRPIRALFNQLFELNSDVLAMGQGDTSNAIVHAKSLANQNLTFNVRFYCNKIQQEAFMARLKDLDDTVKKHLVNHHDDSDSFNQLGKLKRKWVIKTNQFLRYCDHQLLRDLISAVRKLSKFKADLVKDKATYNLAYPQLLELDESSLEAKIASLALTKAPAPATTKAQDTNAQINMVDHSVTQLVTKLSTRIVHTQAQQDNLFDQKQRESQRQLDEASWLTEPKPKSEEQQRAGANETEMSGEIAPDYVSAEAQAALRSIVKFTDADKQLERHASMVLDFYPVCTTSLLSVGASLPCQSALFDLVIFDEAAQFNFIAALPILFRAKRAAIIGDPQQLKPVGSFAQAAIDQTAFILNLSNKLRIRFNLNDTLYAFAKNCYAYKAQEGGNNGGLTELILRQNRRSDASIVSYISQSFYQGQLAASRKIDFEQLRGQKKLLHAVNLGFNFKRVLDSAPQFRSNSRFYPQEVKATIELLQDLAYQGYRGSIGIIAPYRAHVDELNAQIRAQPELAQLNYEIDTVHRFQGKDCDTIIYNLCLSHSAQKEFATDPHIINVALSRARDYLFVVGNPHALLLRSNMPYLANLQKRDDTFLEQGVTSPSLMLAQAMLASHAKHAPRFDTEWEHMLYLAIKQNMEQDPFFNHTQIGFYTQLPMMHYRLDLALIYQDQGLDIECDGSQHYVYWLDAEHNQVVPSDQERENNLAQLKPISFSTIRFRNCLIEQDPFACTQQVLTRLKELILAHPNARGN